MTISIALYQPDMPQNVGSILRTATVFGLKVHIIRPTGFIWNEAKMKRAGMDYLDRADYQLYDSWEAFMAAPPGRLILMTTKGSMPITQFTFEKGDCLLFGRESAGVPDEVHAAVPMRVRIPMVAGERSINLAQTVAIASFEALRQTGCTFKE
jgi:tRNA (cytidine/uridine-2'-O-)-methyltransferase